MFPDSSIDLALWRGCLSPDIKCVGVGCLSTLHPARAADLFASECSPPDFWWIGQSYYCHPIAHWFPNTQKSPLLFWYFFIQRSLMISHRDFSWLLGAQSHRSTEHLTTFPSNSFLLIFSPFLCGFLLMLLNGEMPRVLFSANSLLLMFSIASSYWMHMLDGFKHITHITPPHPNKNPLRMAVP